MVCHDPPGALIPGVRSTTQRFGWTTKPVGLLQRLGTPPLVGDIGEQVFQSRGFLASSRHYGSGSITVLHTRRRDGYGQQQAQCIDEQMALASLVLAPM